VALEIEGIMSMFTDLGTQLGLNVTFYWQLMLSVGFLYFSKVLLFDKLYRVISLRHRQTIGAQTSSINMEAETAVLTEQYEKSLQEHLDRVNAKFTANREVLTGTLDRERQEQEQLLLNEHREKMSELNQVFENMGVALRSETAMLSQELLKKFKL
jgi:F0F1-type ATP synthase membrane subunit b/b'